MWGRLNQFDTKSAMPNYLRRLATATACYLTALPPPNPLHINRTLAIDDDEDRSLVSIQQKIEQLSKMNSVAVQSAPANQQPDTYAKYFPEAALAPREYIPSLKDTVC